MSFKNLEEIKPKFKKMIKEATDGARPPSYMISFYNFIGRLPFKIGVALFLFTGIDTVKVAYLAVKKRTDSAIQVLYRYRFRPWRLLWGIGDHLWQMSYNCRSVRARGIFTKKAISFLLSTINKRSIHIASIGSGSGSQVLQGVFERSKWLNGNSIHLCLVDNDFRTLVLGRKNARALGIEDLISTKEATIGRFLKEAKEKSFDVVEIVGLTDYFSEKKFIQYMSQVYRVIEDKGFFLGANISSDEEYEYAHGVACWPKMHYRPKENLRETLLIAGFNEKNIWLGECGLYTFWIAQK